MVGALPLNGLRSVGASMADGRTPLTSTHNELPQLLNKRNTLAADDVARYENTIQLLQSQLTTLKSDYDHLEIENRSLREQLLQS